MEFKCNLCDTKFRSEFSLNVHMGKTHKEVAENKTFQCPYCDHKAKRKQDLKRHISTKHKCLPNPIKKCLTIFCEIVGCKFGCSSYPDLAKHYARTHGFPAEVKEFNFDSLNEFEQWKEYIESETCTQFVCKSNVTDRRGIQRRFLRCNRSGRFQSKSKMIRKPKAGVSNKVVSTCPAFINLTISPYNNNKVNVVSCQCHYGHDNRLDAQRLPKSVKDQMEQLVLQGVSDNEVVRRIRYPSGEQETIQKRKHIVRKKDVQNLKRSRSLTTFLKDDDDDNDFESVNNSVAPFEATDDNPVTFFQEDITNSVFQVETVDIESEDVKLKKEIMAKLHNVTDLNFLRKMLDIVENAPMYPATEEITPSFPKSPKKNRKIKNRMYVKIRK